MKIVFTTAFPEGMGGGAGRVAEEIAEVFSSQNKVLFIRPGRGTKVKKEKKYLVLEVKSRGQNDLAIPIFSIKDIKLIFKNLDKFSPDIVHGQDNAPISFLVQLWANKNNVPFLFTSHVLPTKTADFGVKEISEIAWKFLNSKVVKKYFLNFFNNCDGVVALNKDVERDIKKLGYRGRLFIIPNGRNLGDYRKNLNGAIERKRLIYIGYLTERKNQQYLIEIMKYLPKNFQLDLVGPSIDGKYPEFLKEYAAGCKLYNVNFLGKVDHAKIPELLQKAGLFVSSSKREVQSLVIIEALASGTPVVSLSNETTKELIDETCGYNFPKGTLSKVFAKKIEEICGLPQPAYLSLCKGAMKKVNYLSWDNVKSEIEKSYRQLINEEEKKKTIKDKKTKQGILFSDLKFAKFFQRQAEKFIAANKKELNYLRSKIGIDKSYLYLFVIITLTFIAGSFYSFMNNLEEIKSKMEE